MSDKEEKPEVHVPKPLEERALGDEYFSTLTSQSGQNSSQQGSQTSNTTDSSGSVNQNNDGKE